MKLFSRILDVSLLLKISFGLSFIGLMGCSGGQNGPSSEDFQEASGVALLAAEKTSCTFNGQILLDGESVTAYLFAQDPDGTCFSEERVCHDGALSGGYIYSSCNDAKTSCRFNGQEIPDGGSIEAFLNSSGETCESEIRSCSKGVLSGSYSYSQCEVDAQEACLFNGQTIESGSSVMAYQNSSVPFGEFCVSETRVCDDGTLSGSYQNGSCQVGAPKACQFNGQTYPHGSQITAYQNSSVPFGDTCVSETRVCNNGAFSGSYGFSSCEADAPKACLFNDRTIASGEHVIGYQNSSVPFGETCQSEERTCVNGVLSGSFNYSSCQVDAPKSCLFNGETIAHGSEVRAFFDSSVPFGGSCQSEVRVCNNSTLSGTYTFKTCSENAPSSCLFNGKTLAHGENVTAFLQSSVSFGEECVSQERTCNNGELSGSYEYPSCNVGAAKSCQFNGHTLAHGETVQAFRQDVVPGGSACEVETRTCENGVLSGSYQFSTCEVTPVEEEPESPEDEELEDVISQNKACDGIFKDRAPAAQDLQGRNLNLNGNSGEVIIADAGDVRINGVSDLVSINGSSSVSLNGNHQALCVKTHHVRTINGVSGKSGVPIVLIGQDAHSFVDVLNGVRKSALVLVNMESTGVINGNNEDIYISGGHISTINGHGGNLYLMHGTVVERINGHFDTVYVYPGSSITNHNGKMNIVTP